MVSAQVSLRSRSFPPLWSFFRTWADPPQIFRVLRFTGEDTSIDLAARGEEHREFSEWCWMPLAEISRQVVHFKMQVYERVCEEFTPLITERMR